MLIVLGLKVAKEAKATIEEVAADEDDKSAQFNAPLWVSSHEYEI